MERTQRVNEQIRVPQVKVVDQDGKMLGAMSTVEALRLANEAGLDLVEVNPNERPPICRIMDYGKFKYEQKKRLSQNAKHTHVHVKEIRLRPKTGEHDIAFKLKRARTFLEHKDKVKINVLFRGRENAHHDLGRQMLLKIIEQLEDVAKVEKAPSMDSPRSMSMVLAPKS
ncbi:MAG: translation initiation factor IF-3 [Planctomycetes bacterium]|nr:translation initiation factor IF-3 [Planctomycetota bacterium]